MMGKRRKEGERGRLKQSIKSIGERDERKVKVDVRKATKKKFFFKIGTSCEIKIPPVSTRILKDAL